jgi:hypothetical protein
MAEDADDRFDFVLNIESEFLEKHHHPHAHVLHRVDCTYFSDGVDDLPRVTEEVAREWLRQYLRRPEDEQLVTFCQRCIVHASGEPRPPFVPTLF